MRPGAHEAALTPPRFSNLRVFLDHLRRENDLAIVAAPVDARLEIAEIHRRVIAAGGPALLFANVPGADFPVATNLFGTRRRAELAFGRNAFDLVRQAIGVLETGIPTSLADMWGLRARLSGLLHVGLRTVRAGPILERVTTDVRLDRLPVLTCWPGDGGPFLTLPLVYTEDPGRGTHNLGIYRMQVFTPDTTGMHWQIAKGGGFHHAAAEARRAALPVTVFLGGPPALTLAAVAPLPEHVPELLLASLILGDKLAVCRGAGPHPLVAEAELALVGAVAPGERQPEGPFGDHYGYYSLRHDYPVFRVERIAHRRDAIYPATVVGKPCQEDFFIGDLLQDLLAPLRGLVMPGVRDLWAYGETGFHALAAAVVAERYRREAMTSAFRILGEGQLSLTKFLLVTDRPVDLRDFRATLAHILARTRPETDLYVMADLAMDTLDYSGPRVNEGSKGVWLGLGDPVRDLPHAFDPATQPPGDVTQAAVFCPGCLVIGGPPFARDPAAGSRLAAHPAFADWPLLVLADEPALCASSPLRFLWRVFTRFEPAADIHACAVELARNHVVRRPPILIDARTKPSYPGEVEADPEIAARVARRWRELFPAGVEMGDPDALTGAF